MKKKNFALILILIILAVFTSLYFLTRDKEGVKPSPTPTIELINSPEPTPSPSPSPTPTPTPLVTKEISIISCGDIMYHMPQISFAYNKETATYDFTDNYKYIKDIVTKASYGVCNFETTLAGDLVPYSGYPRFNAPDPVLDALKWAGFDMVLFSNNHIYDTERAGMLRTLQVAKDKGFDTLGLSNDEVKSYYVKEIDGIKIGFINYGYESNERSSKGDIFINGIFVKKEDADHIDTFNYQLQDEFIKEADKRIKELRNEGAELILFYIHWGDEYQLSQNTLQNQISQKLTNLGVDVIIGSHPHVIQPAKVLINENTGAKTLCFYSLGNFISNQNRLTLETQNKEYTENGVLVDLVIEKIGEQKACIKDVKITPTWVHRFPLQGRTAHQIVPLPYAFDGEGDYGLAQSSFGFDHARVSYDRTKNALQEGINDYLNND